MHGAPPGPTRRGSWCPSRTRTVAAGMRARSRRARSCWRRHCGGDGPARPKSRPPSPPATRPRPRLLTRPRAWRWWSNWRRPRSGPAITCCRPPAPICSVVWAVRMRQRSPTVTKLALWEPPFMVDPDAPRRRQEYVAQLTKLLDAGHRGDAMALFMKTVGLPEAMIAGMRQAPMWPGMEALAHTLAYDANIMGDSTVPTGLVSSVKAPTLVLDGSDTGAWATNSAQALTAALPNPRHRTLKGQKHNVAWDVLAPVLREFFAG